MLGYADRPPDGTSHLRQLLVGREISMIVTILGGGPKLLGLRFAMRWTA
jgi:hypothetical protein